MFTDVPVDSIFSVHNVPNILAVPLLLRDQGLHTVLAQRYSTSFFLSSVLYCIVLRCCVVTMCCVV